MRIRAMLVVFFVCLMSMMAHAQNPVFIDSESYAAVSTGTPQYAGNGAIWFKVSWVPVGTVTTCAFTVDGSTLQGSGYNVGSVIVSQTCTSAGSFMTASALSVLWSKVNVSTLSGGGSIVISYQAYYNNPVGSGSGGTTKVVPATACGTTVFSQAFVLVPSANTAVAAATTCVETIVLTNVTTSVQTITITDNQGSPVTAFNAFPLQPGATVLLPLNGVSFTSGIKWQAGAASSVSGAILGYQ